MAVQGPGGAPAGSGQGWLQQRGALYPHGPQQAYVSPLSIVCPVLVGVGGPSVVCVILPLFMRRLIMDFCVKHSQICLTFSPLPVLVICAQTVVLQQEQAQQGISMAEAFSPASKDTGVLLPTSSLAPVMAVVLNIWPHSPQCD